MFQEVKAKVKSFVTTKMGKVAVIGTAAASNLAVLASAAEETTTTSGLDAVMSSASTATSLVNAVWTMMTANPLLCLFLFSSLLGVGIAIFKRVKGAAGNGKG